MDSSTIITMFECICYMTLMFLDMIQICQWVSEDITQESTSCYRCTIIEYAKQAMRHIRLVTGCKYFQISDRHCITFEIQRMIIQSYASYLQTCIFLCIVQIVKEQSKRLQSPFFQSLSEASYRLYLTDARHEIDCIIRHIIH